MIPERFDAIARALTPPRSRRAVLGLAAGAVAALGAADATVVEAKRRHRHKKKKCKHGRTKCKKKCCEKSEICADGQCVTGQGTCTAGADACAGVGDPFCFDASGDHQCICLTRLEGGTRCGVYGNASTCDQCETDAECIALGFPPGSSCTQDFGTQCLACTGDKGICTIPCGSEDTTS